MAVKAGGKLKKFDVLGGLAQTLCDVSQGFVVGGSWNRDGVLIFGLFPGPGLMQVSAGGGAASPVIKIDPARQETALVFPVFLSDGRRFLYYGESGQPDRRGIYAGSLDAGRVATAGPLVSTSFEADVVPSSSGGPTQLLFRREGTLMAQPFDERTLQLFAEPVPVAERLGSFQAEGFFSASATGVLVFRTESARFQLTWFDRQGTVLGKVGEPALMTDVALSPEERRVAMTRLSPAGDPEIWLLDLERRTDTRFASTQRLVASPVWSPDGSRIAFGASSPNRVALKWANGAEEEEVLVSSPAAVVPLSWSRDGQSLLYSTLDPQTRMDLWVVPLNDREHASAFLHSGSNEDEGRFSPNGRWIAYTSDDSGRFEIYVHEFSRSSGGRWSISNGGGWGARWQGDGKALFYVALDGTIMVVDVAAVSSFQASTPTRLSKFPKLARHDLWDVNRDGTRFLLGLPEQQTAQVPFTVVTNWQASLQR